MPQPPGLVVPELKVVDKQMVKTGLQGGLLLPVTVLEEKKLGGGGSLTLHIIYIYQVFLF